MDLISILIQMPCIIDVHIYKYNYKNQNGTLKIKYERMEKELKIVVYVCKEINY